MFPATRHSVLASVRSPDEVVRARGLDALARAYWRPVYTYLRVRWQEPAEDAEDLTQEFFARALDHDTFERYDAARARFRTFLRLCLDGFVANERKSARRLKRGGGARHLALDVLDFDGAERDVASVATAGAAGAAGAAPDPEELFRRELARSVFGLALDALRAECAAAGKDAHYRLFERYYLDAADPAHRLTYARLAEELAIPATQVTNWLAFARRAFRRHLLEHLRALSGSEDEFRADARDLLGDPT